VTIFLLSFKFFWRELKSGQISLIFLALVIAVTSVSGISIFTNRLEGALLNQSSEFIGGDLRFDSNESLEKDFLNKVLNKNIEHSKNIFFSTMVISNEEMQFASIKVIDDLYPLIGKVQTKTINGKIELIDKGPEKGSVWVDRNLLSLLNTKIGDKINIGKASLFVSRIILSEERQSSNSISFAPKLTMNFNDLKETSVIKTGSRVRYSYFFKANKEYIVAIRSSLETLNKPGDRITEVGNTDGSLGRTLDKSSNYFLLGGLLAVIISFFTIAVGSQRFTRRHSDYVGILKVLGATNLEVKVLYALIFFWLAMFSILFGLGVGWLIQDIFISLFGSFFSSTLPAPSLKPLLVSSITVFISLIGFAYPNLTKLVNISPSSVLYRVHDNYMPKKLNILLILGSIFLLIFFYTNNLLLSLSVLFTLILTSIITLSLFLSIFRTKYTLGMGANSPYRLAWTELHKRRKENAIQVLAFTIAVSLSLIAFSLKSNLVNSWASSIPEDSPNRFAVNITETDIVPIEQFMINNAIKNNILYPLTSIRIEKIIDKNTGVSEAENILIDRSFNMTWTNNIPDNNVIISGNWFNDESSDGLSISSEISERYNLYLGDRVNVYLSNRTFETYIQSIRDVNWDNFTPNFFVIGSPALFKNNRSTYITSFYISNARPLVVTSFIKKFNTVSLLSLDALIDQIKGVIKNVSKALEVILFLTILSSVILTLATIQDSFNLRMHQAAILRTLGASNQLLQKSTVLEFACLGLIAGIFGSCVAQISLYFLETQVFGIEPSLYLSLWLLGPLLSTLIITIVSLGLVLATNRMSPKEILFSS